MMAGVGPFAVPLAKRGHRVFANDLNPDSYSALRDNGFKNKVPLLPLVIVLHVLLLLPSMFFVVLVSLLFLISLA